MKNELWTEPTEKEAVAFQEAGQEAIEKEPSADLTEEQPEAAEKRKKKPYLRVLFGLLGLILAVLLAWELPAVQYLRAQFLFSNGHYEAAYEAFGELGSYKDSEEMRLESRYQQALELRRLGDLNESSWLFREIIDYKDSIALIHYIDPPKAIPVSPAS